VAAVREERYLVFNVLDPHLRPDSTSDLPAVLLTLCRNLRLPNLQALSYHGELH
jgi:hypothetical protein